MTSLLLTATFTLAACSSHHSSSSNSSSSSSQTASSSNASKKTYKIGETITFKDKAEYIITGAEWTDERNEFDDTNPDKVLKITYTVKNLSDDDTTIGGDLELYVEGNKMETYPNGGTFETIGAGRSYEGAVEYFGVKGSGEIELEIEPSFSYGTKPATVPIHI